MVFFCSSIHHSTSCVTLTHFVLEIGLTLTLSMFNLRMHGSLLPYAFGCYLITQRGASRIKHV